METEQQIHKTRNWIATFATLFVLLLAGLFVWRVLYFSSLIKKGDVDLDRIGYLDAFSTNQALASAPLPDGEFDLVTDDDPSLGPVDAPLTIVEFADFGCPYSRQVSFVIRKMIQKYPDKIRLIYRDFPIVDLHPIAQKAAEASECAQEQNKFWEFHDKLYQNQNDLSEERFYELAREVGMNESRFRNCLNSARYAQEVATDLEEGFAAGVRGTPTFFINGNRVAGSIPEKVFEEIIAGVSNKAYEP